MAGRACILFEAAERSIPLLISASLRGGVTCSRGCCLSRRPEQRRQCPTQACTPNPCLPLHRGGGEEQNPPLAGLHWADHRGTRGQKTPTPQESESVQDSFIELSQESPSPGRFPSFLQSLALKHHLLLRSKDTRPDGRRMDCSSRSVFDLLCDLEQVTTPLWSLISL